MSNKLIYPISLVMVLALAGFAQAELLVNGDFEAGTDSWGVWGSGSGSGSGGYIGWNSNSHATVMEDGTAHGGNKYVETGFLLGNAEWWGWGYANFYQAGIPITAGSTYQISAWVRDGDANGATSLIADGTQILYEWWVDANTRLDANSDGDWGNDVVRYNFDLTGEWTQISATELAPPGVMELTAVLGTGMYNLNVDVDDASVMEGAGYLWNGSAADGLWDTPANWTVTNSTWTWPNEEAAAANAIDPNAATKWTNADTLGIYILNGDAVTHNGWLAIQGEPDGSTTGVLTLNNGSSLSLNGRLATSTTSGMMGRGQINILGGSTVTITDGKDLRIADDNNNRGTLNIVDSTVDVADDLVTDVGEGHINVSGSSILNADDIVIADPNNSLGYLNISGTSVVTVVDDLRIDQGVGYITISGDAIVSVDDEIYVGDNVNGLGYLDISGNATIIDVDDLKAGDDGEGHVTISGNALFKCDDVQVADETTSVGTLDISGNAWVFVNDDFSAGEDGIGTASISGDASVLVRDLLYVAHDAGEGTLNISDNATVVIPDDLNVGNAGGVTATLNISGNPTISVRDDLLMNDDDDGVPSNSKITMDGGTVYIGDQTSINDDNSGMAEFIMNGGSFYSDDDIYVSDNLNGTAHLTVNGGSMITGDGLKLGESGGEDIGQARVFMNGGLLQAEWLGIDITDSQIVYSGGEFRIADVNEAEMQQLITDGTIVPTGAYSIDTDGDYTVLSTLSPAAAKFPSPADGASDVLIGSSLSWTPGDTAETHDVYFDTANPPALAGNQAEASYYPGLLQADTTYYWQIDEVEADGTTKHAGSVNSFTTGSSNVAMQIRIKASSDDTESDINGDNNPTSGDLEFPYDGNPAPDEIQLIGLRFADVGLAKGTTITSAAVQFSEDDTDDSRHAAEVHIIIDGQLNPNPDTFVDVNDAVADRQPRTAAKVEWDPPLWSAVTHTEGPEARTSDVSSIIQELIDQDGWAAGNALVLILSDNPDNPSVGMREAESFDGDEGNAERRPTLHVTAIVDAATGPSPANGATDVPITDTILSWWPGVGAVSHDGYAGTTSPPPFLGNTPAVTFDPGVLEPSTTYYWQIDAVDADATKHAGQIWSFVTSPGEATEPDPADGALLGVLDVTLTWRSGATAVSRDVYFGTTSPPPLIGNQAEASFTSGTLQADTTYYWQVDEIDAGAKKYTGEIWSFKTPRPGTGTILYELWDGIGGGNEVSILTGNENYPLNPSSSTELSSFDAPVDRAEEFGGRIHGYLTPVTSGDYTFWIASDDNGELWLSTDDSPANAVLVSTLSASAGHLNFDDGDLTPSGPIPLVGGQKYYISALYKEGGGGDNCAVAWEGPDSPERAVIGGYFLSPFVQLKAFNPDPADGAIEVSKTATLSWLAGATAATHDVYFSTDSAAVSDGTALMILDQAETSYSPAGLEKGFTYYWRVDEVEADGTTTHAGDVWSFTVTTLGR